MKLRGTFYLNYDLDALTFKYGVILGRERGSGGVKTTGASTTIDAVDSGAFTPVLVGDYVQFQIGETWTTVRKVLTKPSNDQITISGAAINLGARAPAWYYSPFRIGATAADGALSTDEMTRAWVEFDAPTIAAAGGVDYSIEVKSRTSATWGVSVAGTFVDAAAVVAAGPIEIPELLGQIRVGLKGTAGFAGTDDISVYLVGQPGVVKTW
jgi:hypothetical protein